MRRAAGPRPAGRFTLVVALGTALLLALTSPARAQQSEADVFVAQAILAYEDRRYDEALAFLRQALAQDPDNLDALYYTGLTLFAQRKPAEAVVPLERARRRAPNDLALLYQLGVAYFSLKDYDRAEEPLTTVFRAQPQADGVGYYVGFMRYRKRDYRGALEALRAGASDDPDIQQLSRFYAGLSLAALGERDAAVAEVQEALRIQSTSALAGPAERLRDTVLAPRRRDQRLQVELRAGLTYDTNVMVLPNPSHDPIAEATRERRDEQSSLGELFSARFEYTFLRTGPWEASVGYQFFQLIYNDLPSFNIQSHLGTVAGSYTGKVGDMPWQAAVSYAYDYTTLDDDEFLQRHTVGLVGVLVEGPVNLTALQFRYQHKDFSNKGTLLASDVRDANNWMGGCFTSFASRATGTWYGWAISSTRSTRRDCLSTIWAIGPSWAASTPCPGGAPASATTSTSTSGTTSTSARSSPRTRPPRRSARTWSRLTSCASSSRCRRASRSLRNIRESSRSRTCPSSATTAACFR